MGRERERGEGERERGIEREREREGAYLHIGTPLQLTETRPFLRGEESE